MDFEQIVTLAMNNGMSILITCYFLFRDWKYQEKLTTLLASLDSTIRTFQTAVASFTEELRNDK